MRTPTVLTAALLSASLALTATEPTGSAPGPGTVTGVVRDGQGKPVAGARVWIKPALTTGLIQARTDANGRYTAETLVPVIPYNTYVWYKFPYRGKDVCFRVAPVSAEQYDPFVAKKGVVRDFQLRVSGPMDDREGAFFGGELRIFRQTPEKVELTFVPDGPLADGSAGRKFTRVVDDEPVLTDMPVGVYRVSAQIVDRGGNRRAARVSRDSEEKSLASTAIVDWQSKDSCVGSYGGGVDRSFLYVQ